MKRTGVLLMSGGAILVALGSFVYVYRDGLALASAAALNRSRPDFMGDISWNDDRSDVLIKRRFPVGSAEADLIDALRARRFSVKPAERIAELRLQNLPCNELLEVRWNADEQGKLTDVQGAASEAGCL